MCDSFSQSLLRVAVADLLRQEGYTHLESASLSTFTDVSLLVFHQIAVLSTKYAQCLENRSPTALDIKRVLSEELKIGMTQLTEYLEFIDNNGEAFPLTFPKFPIKREVESENQTSEFSESSVPLSDPLMVNHIPDWLPPFPPQRTFKSGVESENEKAVRGKRKRNANEGCFLFFFLSIPSTAF
jgi:hypothetical protein